ncbi:capsid maturation protease [Microbacterium phage Zenitsu]|uniref:Capsid maturation protease n=1 Tax=Microbacterium phage MCubed TaxID=2593339 RepID=A0A514U3Y4_9CAUD|nr:capsid maturation protease [Microbacterium phage MCubed]WNN93805.1 capsid maturation protease [Microbacterium phage Zenitsu]
MPTIPTGRMERELRKLYLSWVMGLSFDNGDMTEQIAEFRRRSEALIISLGGRVASLGALGDFPAPKLLELSPYAGKVYEQMQLAAIQAGIMTGLNSRAVAQAMFRAGMDKSYRRLERLARTETTNAYWKNTWNSVANLPDIVLVWGAEESKRTCAFCLDRDGLVVEDPTIRDHPNGRCTLVPTHRSLVEYKGTLRADGSVYDDPRWGGHGKVTAPAKGAPKPTTPDTLSEPVPQGRGG